MSWRPVAPGRYERDLYTMERFYRAIAANNSFSGNEQYFVSAMARLKVEPSVRDLQDAWKTLRCQHPQIVVNLNDTGSRMIYSVPSEEDLEIWVRDTLIVYSDLEGISVDDLNSRLKASPQFMLYYIPSTRELLFRSPHWRIDGVGMLLLLDAFFRILAQGSSEPVFDGSEITRMPPSIDEVANLPQEITPARQEDADADLAVLFQGSTPFALPTKSGSSPANSNRLGTRLSQALTKQIISTCKARDYTVTAAVQAALTLVTRDHSQDPHGRFVTFNNFDLRKYLPEPWKGTQGAASLYHTGLPCSFDFATPQGFHAIARALTSHFRQDVRRTYGHMVAYVNKLGEMLSIPLEQSIQAPGHPGLSSLGVIEDRMKSQYTGANTIEIEDWWMGLQIVNRTLLTYIWTRDGQLHLEASYNEAFYERNFVEQFLNDWKTCVVNELTREQTSSE